MPYETLLDDEMVAILPPGSTHIDMVHLKDNAEGLVLTKAAAQTLAEQTKQTVRIGPRQNFLVQDTDTVVRLVTAGMGIGIVSRFALGSVPCNLDVCRVNPEIHIEVGIAALDLKNMTPAATKLLRILRERFLPNER